MFSCAFDLVPLAILICVNVWIYGIISKVLETSGGHCQVQDDDYNPSRSSSI